MDALDDIQKPKLHRPFDPLSSTRTVVSVVFLAILDCEITLSYAYVPIALHRKILVFPSVEVAFLNEPFTVSFVNPDKLILFLAYSAPDLLSPALVKVLNRGFLGAFTTLSAVCGDADELLAFGNDLGAFLYVALTFVLSFGAALAAMRIFGVRKTFLAQDATAANVLCASLTEAGERL